MLTIPQRIERIPEIFKSLQETVLDCNRHFETVIKEAKDVFKTDNARRALDDWIDLVIKVSEEIRLIYAESKAGARILLSQDI